MVIIRDLEQDLEFTLLFLNSYNHNEAQWNREPISFPYVFKNVYEWPVVNLRFYCFVLLTSKGDFSTYTFFML